MHASFVDIHCHLLPGIDDGAADVATSLAMARLAEQDGTHTIICTPHQLGSYGGNRGDAIRRAVAQLQRRLAHGGHSLQVLPGADVRIEDGMLEQLDDGNVLTLADRGKHVLLELPHELYFPLEPLLDQLRAQNLVGILSHPERNQGLLRDRSAIGPLVDAGCLMQVTAGSLTGSMGSEPQRMAEWMLAEGFVHFLATDAHGARSRRPRMRRAFERAAELAGLATAEELCISNPAAVAAGLEITVGRRRREKPSWLTIFSLSSRRRRNSGAKAPRTGPSVPRKKAA